MTKQIKQDKGYELAAVVRYGNGRRDGYGNVWITFSQLRPSEVDRKNYLYTPYNGELDGLQVSCQWNTLDNDNVKAFDPYAWEVGYTSNTTTENFTRRVPTLQKIQRGLEREAAKNGTPETFGEYAQRVCNIMGVEVVLEVQSGRYNIDDVRFRQPGQVREIVRGILEAAKREVSQ